MRLSTPTLNISFFSFPSCRLLCAVPTVDKSLTHHSLDVLRMSKCLCPCLWPTSFPLHAQIHLKSPKQFLGLSSNKISLLPSCPQGISQKPLSVFHHVNHSFISALSYYVLSIHFVAGIWETELNGLRGKGQVPIN